MDSTTPEVVVAVAERVLGEAAANDTMPAADEDVAAVPATVSTLLATTTSHSKHSTESAGVLDQPDQPTVKAVLKMPVSAATCSGAPSSTAAEESRRVAAAANADGLANASETHASISAKSSNARVSVKRSHSAPNNANQPIASLT